MRRSALMAGCLVCGWVLGAALLPGCGGPGPADTGPGKDGGADAGSHDAGAFDAGSDGGADAGACTLGSADHCVSCGNSCPGTDDVGTRRVCVAGTTCDIYCQGEFYDVNGQVQDGCEAEDAPVQDSVTAARAIGLPDFGGADAGTASLPCDGTINPCTVAAGIYGDARVHDTAPQYRAIGREDWFKVTATGAASPNGVMKTCLWVGNFPADNQFSVCISEAGSQTMNACANAVGGAASACVQPSGTADTGIFYVRVKKMAGAATANQYALYLEH